MQATSTTPHVLIMGAGIGGLTLAQGLKRAGISFSVFERDQSANFRPQGYRIRINSDGIHALKTTLGPELWDLFERTCAELKLGKTQMNGLDGSVINSKGGVDISRNSTASTEAGKLEMPFTADRATLRGLLLMGLDGHVFFEKKFEKYIETLTGVTVHFSDGTSEEGTLLVGADGLRSGVRRQYLPKHNPVDTDGRCIYGKTPLTKELVEKFPAEAMNWMTYIQDKRQKIPLSLVLEPIRFPRDVEKESNGKLPSVKDYVYWVLLSRRSTFGVEDSLLLSLSHEEAAKTSLKLTEDWDPAIRSLLELQDVTEACALRLYTHMPNVPSWTPSAHITVLGDAIHVMPPTGGVGANTALRDAVNLCEAIVKGGISAESIGRYEEQMMAYKTLAIESSSMGGKILFDQPPFEECLPVNF